MTMRILQVSAELFPLLKTGGLADVAGALPAALHTAGCEVRVLLPGFPQIRAALQMPRVAGAFTAPWGEPLRILEGEFPDVAVGGRALRGYVLEAPGLLDRPGNPYEDAQRRPYGDNHRRFAALGWAARQLAAGLDAVWVPQIVHAHDWHAALAMACLKLAPVPGRHTPCVYTVHNLAYQGLFGASHLAELGLPSSAFSIDGLEFHGQISFMKAGLSYADRITTVSPTYAREIQQPDQGCGLDGLLRARRDRLSGILNGVDDAVWNPATDTLLPARYDRDDLTPKARCKAALQAESGLEVQANAPLAAAVSRLTEQKGMPLVLAAAEVLLASGGQLVLLGSGDADLEKAFTGLARAHPGRVAVRLGYDEAYAHRIFAGSDLTLVPSRYEPCGLTQMYGLKYGSLPVVRRVGGLADTVIDTDLATLEDGSATGFAFDEFSIPALRHALRRALALYRRPVDWARVRHTGMSHAFSWTESSARYADLYRALLRP